MTLARESGLPTDWSDEDRKAYADNVETWLELERSQEEAERMARGMVERWRAPHGSSIRV